MPVTMNMSVRMPLAVHSALTKAANASGRSLNAEIVDRLNRSLGNVYLDEKDVDKDVLRRIADLESKVAKLEKRR